MGKVLIFNEPVDLITFKRYSNRKLSQESRMQYLRLWKCGNRQSMMYHGNMSNQKYNEYDSKSPRAMERFYSPIPY